MSSFRTGAEVFSGLPSCRATGEQRGRLLVTAKSPSEMHFTKKQRISDQNPCLSEGPNPALAAHYSQKMIFHRKMTPAPSTPWGFPPCSQPCCWSGTLIPQGFTEQQQKSTEHLKISFIKPPKQMLHRVSEKGTRD